MTEVRSDFSAVTFGDQIFAIGGFNGTDELATVELFDVEQQLWRPYTSLVTPRWNSRCHFILASCHHHSAVAQGDCVRGQDLCSGWVRWHLEAEFGGVLHPWTSWQRTNLAPGWMGFLNFVLQTFVIARWLICWNLEVASRRQ